VMIYERLQRSARPNVEERLLPRPEAPLPKPPGPALPTPADAAVGNLPPVTTPETSAPAAPTQVASPSRAEPVIAVPPAAPIAPAAPSGRSEPQQVVRADQGVFRIQIASVRVEDQAQADWFRLVQLHRDLLAGLQMTVSKADLGPEKGVFYRIRAGEFGDRGAAERLCLDLKARGVSCLVVKN
jgi:SPOR domain